MGETVILEIVRSGTIQDWVQVSAPAMGFGVSHNFPPPCGMWNPSVSYLARMNDGTTPYPAANAFKIVL